ncbi:unnamed protein product [Larinioides sclopetarius]|uniref:Uncharacterized protein n=1 Tax=Larinioides sclopetarius TaxID=280406 RepID=A0AAV2BML3_9ARAC
MGRCEVSSKEHEDVSLSSREIQDTLSNGSNNDPFRIIYQFVKEELANDEEYPIYEEIEKICKETMINKKQYIANKYAVYRLDKAEKFSKFFFVDAPSPAWLPFLSYLFVKFLGIN